MARVEIAARFSLLGTNSRMGLCHSRKVGERNAPGIKCFDVIERWKQNHGT